MKFTDITSISDVKPSSEYISNFWRAMLRKYYYELYVHLIYLFATNWLAKLLSRYLLLFGDFGANETRDFVEDQLAFQEISEIQYKISEEIDE